MNINKSGLLSGAAAIAILALVVWAFVPDPISVAATKVERGPMRVTLDEDGEVRAFDRYVVAAPVGGQLLRVGLREGDRVERGQIVARIAPAPLTERERGEQVARVAGARALKLEAEELVRKAQATLDQAERERKRADTLVARGFISKEAAEQAHVAVTNATVGLDAARYRARASAAEVRAAEASLVALRANGAAGRALIEIKAPAAGEVLRVHEKSERVLASGAPIVTLGNPARFEVVLDYLTTDAVRIKPGMTVLLDNWGGGILKARVRLVEPGAFTKVSALGVVEQRTNVIADFLDPPGPLNDGYRVDGRVVIWEAEDALKVPVASLFRLGGEWAVFVVDGARVRSRPVRIGQRNALEAQVLEGLSAGELVVRHPPNDLSAGARVALQEQRAR